MDSIPPFDWSEVLLKKDLDIFEGKIHGYISQVMEKQTRTFIGWMFTGNSILIAAFAAIVIFAK